MIEKIRNGPEQNNKFELHEIISRLFEIYKEKFGEEIGVNPSGSFLILFKNFVSDIVKSDKRKFYSKLVWALYSEDLKNKSTQEREQFINEKKQEFEKNISEIVDSLLDKKIKISTLHDILRNYLDEDVFSSLEETGKLDELYKKILNILAEEGEKIEKIKGVSDILIKYGENSVSVKDVLDNFVLDRYLNQEDVKVVIFKFILDKSVDKIVNIESQKEEMIKNILNLNKDFLEPKNINSLYTEISSSKEFSEQEKQNLEKELTKPEIIRKINILSFLDKFLPDVEIYEKLGIKKIVRLNDGKEKVDWDVEKLKNLEFGDIERVFADKEIKDFLVNKDSILKFLRNFWEGKLLLNYNGKEVVVSFDLEIVKNDNSGEGSGESENNIEFYSSIIDFLSLKIKRDFIENEDNVIIRNFLNIFPEKFIKIGEDNFLFLMGDKYEYVGKKGTIDIFEENAVNGAVKKILKFIDEEGGEGQVLGELVEERDENGKVLNVALKSAEGVDLSKLKFIGDIELTSADLGRIFMLSALQLDLPENVLNFSEQDLDDLNKVSESTSKKFEGEEESGDGEKKDDGGEDGKGNDGEKDGKKEDGKDENGEGNDNKKGGEEGDESKEKSEENGEGGEERNGQNREAKESKEDLLKKIVEYLKALGIGIKCYSLSLDCINNQLKSYQIYFEDKETKEGEKNYLRKLFTAKDLEVKIINGIPKLDFKLFGLNGTLYFGNDNVEGKDFSLNLEGLSNKRNDIKVDTLDFSEVKKTSKLEDKFFEANKKIGGREYPPFEAVDYIFKKTDKGMILFKVEKLADGVKLKMVSIGEDGKSKEEDYLAEGKLYEIQDFVYFMTKNGFNSWTKGDFDNFIDTAKSQLSGVPIGDEKKWVSIKALRGMLKGVGKKIKEYWDNKYKEQEEFLDNFVVGKVYDGLSKVLGKIGFKGLAEYLGDMADEKERNVQSIVFEKIKKILEGLEKLGIGPNLGEIKKILGGEKTPKSTYHAAAYLWWTMKKGGLYIGPYVEYSGEGRWLQLLFKDKPYYDHIMSVYNNKKSELLAKISDAWSLGYGVADVYMQELKNLEIDMIVDILTKGEKYFNSGENSLGEKYNDFIKTYQNLYSKSLGNELKSLMRQNDSASKIDDEKNDLPDKMSFEGLKSPFLKNAINSRNGNKIVAVLEKMAEAIENTQDWYYLNNLVISLIVSGVVKYNFNSANRDRLARLCKTVGIIPGSLIKDENIKEILNKIISSKVGKIELEESPSKTFENYKKVWDKLENNTEVAEIFNLGSGKIFEGENKNLLMGILDKFLKNEESTLSDLQSNLRIDAIPVLNIGLTVLSDSFYNIRDGKFSGDKAMLYEKVWENLGKFMDEGKNKSEDYQFFLVKFMYNLLNNYFYIDLAQFVTVFQKDDKLRNYYFDYFNEVYVKGQVMKSRGLLPDSVMKSLGSFQSVLKNLVSNRKFNVNRLKDIMGDNFNPENIKDENLPVFVEPRVYNQLKELAKQKNGTVKTISTPWGKFDIESQQAGNILNTIFADKEDGNYYFYNVLDRLGDNKSKLSLSVKDDDIGMQTNFLHNGVLKNLIERLGNVSSIARGNTSVDFANGRGINIGGNNKSNSSNYGFNEADGTESQEEFLEAA